MPHFRYKEEHVFKAIFKKEITFPTKNREFLEFLKSLSRLQGYRISIIKTIFHMSIAFYFK